MIIDIDIETLFPEGLSDEAISAISHVLSGRYSNPTQTSAENKLLYGFLRTFRYRVLRQRPIDNYIVDFYCAQLKVVIEIDGETHFSNEGKEYDDARTKVLEGYGLRVLRFTNDEVLKNFEAVCDVIEKIPPTPLTKGGKGGS